MIEKYKKIKIVCETQKELSVDEFSRFFYYLNNIYKILVSSKEEKDIRFLHLKKMPEEQRLRISIIRKNNPLQFELLIPYLISSLTLFIEIIKLIRDSYTNKEIVLNLRKMAKQNEILIKEIEKILRLKEIKISGIEDKDENETQN